MALRRMWRQRLLVGCLLLGWIAAAALSASIPLYADAVQFKLLQHALAEDENQRPPFAFMFRYVGAWHGAVAWEDYQPVDTYLRTQAPAALGLPLQQSVFHVRSEDMRLFADEKRSPAAYARREPLIWTNLGFISGLEEHIRLVEGRWPETERGGDEAMAVVISKTLADQLGVQVGEQYLLFGQNQNMQIPTRIAGIWQAQDESDDFWFYRPETFAEMLLVSEETFAEHVSAILPESVYQAVWYHIFDGENVRTAAIPGLMEGVVAMQSRAVALLFNLSLDVSPVEALENYSAAARLLTLQLTLFALPVLGLLLYFIILIAGMLVQRRQNEIAVLRSRGATRGQIVGLHLLEGLLLGLLVIVLGLGLGQWLARYLGATRSFLQMQYSPADGSLPITLSRTAFYYAAGAMFAGLLAGLLPSLASSRHTIITYKQEIARILRPPSWQRAYLDLLLLLPALYGYYVLKRQGTISPLVTSSSPLAAPDLFQNPLLFIVPALFSFALALIFVRLFPLLMRGLAGLAETVTSIPMLLALRHLARSPTTYLGPLTLLVLTLSLAAFTASMAQTLDAHLFEQSYYQVGADMNLAELGESTETRAQPGLSGQAQTAPAVEQNGPKWLFLPVSEHLNIPGVQAAARVGNYTALARLKNRQEIGRVLGVDRVDFGNVAFYRPDFAAGESLIELMNRLALVPNHILVGRSFLARHSLDVGDPLVLTIQAAEERAEMEFIVAGALDLFPTSYPQDGPLFVANLDALFQALGEAVPYDVWLRLDTDADQTGIIAAVRDSGIQVVGARDAQTLILQGQSRPERQGVFGLLSIGFWAAAALTVLGFLVYTVVSFQRRFITLGTLRSVGLSVAQMSFFLLLEQSILLLSGILAGVCIGVGASTLFIPFLQIGQQTPPFVVRIAWDDIWLIVMIFGAMLMLAIAILIVLLRRMRLFEAVKLGETL